MTPRVEILPPNQLPAAFLDEIDAVYFNAFLANDTDYQGIQWPKAALQLIVYEGQDWVTLVELHHRKIRVGGQEIYAGGVGGVLTRAEHRSKGYAKMAVRQATNYLCQEFGVEFGLLICKEYLVPYYAALDWQLVESKMFFEQDGEQRTFEHNIACMIYPCTEKPWPSGDIDMMGSPW
jgi:aminoglycoside 2'-N-acetyltransferase I